VRAAKALLAAALALLALAPAAHAAHPAQGNFGLEVFDVSIADAEGATVTQAGAHPFALTTSLAPNVDGEGVPEGWLRDIVFQMPPGLVGDTTAYTKCTNADFLAVKDGISSCPDESAVGINAVSADNPGDWRTSPVYNLTPPPGVLLRLGFTVLSSNVVVDAGLRQSPPYNATAASRNTTQVVQVLANKLQLWGYPADSRHDDLRGVCGVTESVQPGVGVREFEFEGSGGTCEASESDRPLLTLPTSCAAPAVASYEALSWEGETAAGSLLIHDAAGRPQPFTGCGRLPFKPEIDAAPTSLAAQSPTGLDFTLAMQDEGLRSAKPSPSGEEPVAASAVRKAVVTLPRGMTLNPSQAEGLETCGEAQLEAETVSSAPGQGCPQASKIGTVEVDSPLVSETLRGALFVATPYENLAGDSLIAVYMVIKSPELGVIVKQPLRVEPDPSSGRLVTYAEEIPQLPFSSFRLRFREGARSPLVSPPGCGGFEVSAELYPWSGGPPLRSGSRFEIVSGPQGSPCPAGPAPFAPRFEAGSQNNAAGAYSPFQMRIARADGEQDIARFSAALPPGVLGRLAGVPYCPEAGIARAAARGGPHGGAEELADPSCPAASEIGTTIAGAGVGSQLTYVPGSLYLAGPYNGAPLSVVSITPALAGPFDAGTVLVREALTIDPLSAEVRVDGAASDPIPHILKGIPLNLRELRVNVDRPRFTLNPTSCQEGRVAATLWGAGTALAPAPESPVDLFSRYQAAGCASLGFKPRLGLRLRGKTRRGGFPALRAVYSPRPGDANLRRLALAFPRSEFIEQGHFRTICTRVQFAAGPGHGARCPKGSVYGHAKVWTPLLDEPLKGPVYLRSSNHNLPDAVLALHGIVDLEVAIRIDSVKGRLRTIAPAAPDAPVSRALVQMQGGQKGLFVNSTELCAARHRARVALKGQNARKRTLRPLVRPTCKQAKRKRHRRHRRG